MTGARRCRGGAGGPRTLLPSIPRVQSTYFEGGSPMPVYVQLITWTERGGSAAKETVQRARRAREQAQKLGARLRESIWTKGRYDAVAILEAPNAEGAGRFV